MRAMWRMTTMACVALAIPVAHAQDLVYKCSEHSYSQAPCSSRVVRTYDAPVVPSQSRPRDVVAQRLPGESPAEFSLRKRRAHLTDADRDECARLDKKIPFEEQRLKTGVWQEEIDAARDSLAGARKRFAQLRC